LQDRVLTGLERVGVQRFEGGSAAIGFGTAQVARSGDQPGSGFARNPRRLKLAPIPHLAPPSGDAQPAARAGRIQRATPTPCAPRSTPRPHAHVGPGRCSAGPGDRARQPERRAHAEYGKVLGTTQPAVRSRRSTT
jgi:hypothetical protein